MFLIYYITTFFFFFLFVIGITVTRLVAIEHLWKKIIAKNIGFFVWSISKFLIKNGTIFQI